MPGASQPNLAPFWPDQLAPAGRNLYIFGFRNVTGLTDSQVALQRGHAQISAPQLVFDQDSDYRVKLSNLGSVGAARPRRRPHHPLARVRERHPALRRRPRALDLRAHRAQLHLLLPAARPGHVHVPLPLRGRRARPDGDDRAAVRAARSRTELPSPTAARRSRSSPTTAATDPQVTTASSGSSSPRSSPRATTATPTSRRPTGRTSRPASGASTAGPTPTRWRRTRQWTRSHPARSRSRQRPLRPLPVG